MEREQKQKGKNRKGLSFFVILFVLMLISGAPGDASDVLLVMFFLLLPAALAVGVFVAVKKQKTAAPSAHSHDRIDHRRDITINPKTGKAENRSVRQQAHSPREHWKQQLDGLLENGTIDKAEYRAMLNRKFE